MSDTLFWLIMTLASTVCMSFFSTQEMACISYNRLKLEVEIQMGSKRAQWIKALVQRPTVLFGTTLVGVNLFLVISSECMRQLFESVHLNPTFSVFLLVPYLLLFGELIPMFAARTFPEHTAHLGAPILWATSLLITPFAYLSEAFFRTCFKPWMKNKKEKETSLFQHEELQELIRPFAQPKREDENPAEQLFSTLQRFSHKKVSSFMVPKTVLPKLYDTMQVRHALNRLRQNKRSVGLIYTKHRKILGIITQESLLCHEPQTSVHLYAKLVPFINAASKASDALALMIEKKALHSFVLDPHGEIIGLVCIDSLLEEFLPKHRQSDTLQTLHISKTLAADTRIADFCTQYGVHLSFASDRTFAEVLEEILDHKPKIGEKVFLGPLEVIVKEASLLGAKSLFIQSR